MVTAELNVFGAFYFWALRRCAIDNRVCDHQRLDNRSDASPGADPAILPALFGFRLLRYCPLSAWKALARRADGKTYGREDFLGRLFRSPPVEGHYVHGGAFFLVSAGDLQLFRQYVSYLHHYRYTKPD